MSSLLRYVSGDTNPVAVLCEPTTPIEVGDLLYQDPVTRTAKPAAAMANQGSEALNQDAFQQFFLGVALQRNGLQAGETVPLHSTLEHSPPNTIEVATAGRFLFDCAAAAWNTGDLVGPANNAGGTALLNQTVKAAANASRAIGRAAPAAEAIGQSLSHVIVDIQSTIMGGGAQVTVPGSSSGAV